MNIPKHLANTLLQTSQEFRDFVIDTINGNVLTREGVFNALKPHYGNKIAQIKEIRTISKDRKAQLRALFPEFKFDPNFDESIIGLSEAKRFVETFCR